MSAEAAQSGCQSGQDDVLVDLLLFADDSRTAILPYAVQIAAELAVADVLASGARQVHEISRVLGTDRIALYRLLRALASVGLFREVEPERFALTSLGSCLRSGAASSVRYSMMNHDSHRAWLQALTVIRSGRSAFEEVFHASFFQHKDVSEAANERFLRRMSERSTRLYGRWLEVVDWSRSNVVLDIGGGDGALLARLLSREARLHGILFDRPSVLASVPCAELTSRFGARCRLDGGDFFERLPSGADTHLLCSVLHDWPEAPARVILENSRRAIDKDGRLLIVEMIVPPGDAFHPSKWSDLGMMVVVGGKERTEAEFINLLDCSGYVLEGITPIPGSYFCLLQAAVKR